MSSVFSSFSRSRDHPYPKSLSQAHRGAGMKIHMSTSMASAMEKYIVFIQDCGDHGIRMLERSHCMIIAFAAMPVDASKHVGRQVRVHGSSKI
jgi:hypothetical protein